VVDLDILRISLKKINPICASDGCLRVFYPASMTLMAGSMIALARVAAAVRVGSLTWIVTYTWRAGREDIEIIIVNRGRFTRVHTCPYDWYSIIN
jgi:hypothetical protein